LIRGIDRRSTFDRLRREGIRVRRGPLGLTFVPLDDARPQVGFAIGRRVGNAVVRNRCRRRVRALLAGRAAAGSLAPGAYLVHVSSAVDELPAAELAAGVDAVLGALAKRRAA
jgi:ribonuclease P protein component